MRAPAAARLSGRVSSSSSRDQDFRGQGHRPPFITRGQAESGAADKGSRRDEMLAGMRVCLVYDCLFPHTVGGAERWYANLAERLAAEGHEVTYLTLRQWPKG